MSKNKYTKSGARNSATDKQRIAKIRDHAQNIHALTMELQPDEVASPAAVPAIPTHDGALMKATPEQIQQLQNGEIPGGMVGDCAICGPGDVQAAWDYCCQQDNADELKQQCVDICCECGWEDALPEDAAPYMEDEDEDGGVEIEINVKAGKDTTDIDLEKLAYQVADVINKSAKGDGVKTEQTTQSFMLQQKETAVKVQMVNLVFKCVSMIDD